MHVRFWGTRGSVPRDCPPSLLREKLVGALLLAQGRVFPSRAEAARFVDDELPAEFGPGFGGATPCVEVSRGGETDTVLLLDAGSGLAEFGRRWKDDPRSATPTTFHLLLSHLHWDHIQGLPFFEPAYSPRNRIVIHACHPAAEATLRAQMDSPWFPVPFSTMRATISFEVHGVAESFEFGGFHVRARLQSHPGDSYAYRIEADGKTLVYATDAEYTTGDPGVAQGVAAFFRDADLLIFEAMFTRDEVVYEKTGWGHASHFDGVELAALGRVKRLALFHHDPAASDERLAAFEAEARDYAKRAGQVTPRFPGVVFMARDGQSLAL